MPCTAVFTVSYLPLLLMPYTINVLFISSDNQNSLAAYVVQYFFLYSLGLFHLDPINTHSLVAYRYLLPNISLSISPIMPSHQIHGLIAQ